MHRGTVISSWRRFSDHDGEVSLLHTSPLPPTYQHHVGCRFVLDVLFSARILGRDGPVAIRFPRLCSLMRSHPELRSAQLSPSRSTSPLRETQQIAYTRSKLTIPLTNVSEHAVFLFDVRRTAFSNPENPARSHSVKRIYSTVQICSSTE